MTTDPIQTSRSSCKYCREGHTRDAGGSYDRSACKARWCREKIVEVERRMREGKALLNDEKLLQSLKRDLEHAEYVGD